MRTWLENLNHLEKIGPKAAPESRLAKTESQLPSLLSVLLRSDADFLDAGTSEVDDPVSALIAKTEAAKFGISEISPAILGKSAGMQAGERVEPGVGGTWTHHYRHGVHVASRFDDSVKSSGVMHFDHAGKEVSAEAYADLLKNPTLQAAAAIANLPENFSKLLGLSDLQD